MVPFKVFILNNEEQIERGAICYYLLTGFGQSFVQEILLLFVVTLI